MLSIKTMRLLAEYLLEAVISSASLQPYRQCLASIIGFDGTMIFHYLDQSCKGYLIAKDLVPLIRSEPNQYACQRIFSQIDSNNQKRVNRLQFISYFLPREDLALRQVISARITTNESYEESMHFKQQLNVISRMFQHILRSQSQKLGTLRNALLNKKDYSTHGVMNVLDSDKKGWIQAQDIQKFVRGQGIPIYIQDIYRLIQMHDHNMDGKLFQDSIVRLIYCGQANVPLHISQKQTQKKNKITAGKISKKIKSRYQIVKSLSQWQIMPLQQEMGSIEIISDESEYNCKKKEFQNKRKYKPTVIINRSQDNQANNSNEQQLPQRLKREQQVKSLSKDSPF